VDYFAIIHVVRLENRYVVSGDERTAAVFYEKRTIYIKMKLAYYLVVTIEYV